MTAPAPLPPANEPADSELARLRRWSRAWWRERMWEDPPITSAAPGERVTYR